jgi:hypothetical protein
MVMAGSRVERRTVSAPSTMREDRGQLLDQTPSKAQHGHRAVAGATCITSMLDVPSRFSEVSTADRTAAPFTAAMSAPENTQYLVRTWAGEPINRVSA